jgi:hypothetical protein
LDEHEPHFSEMSRWFLLLPSRCARPSVRGNVG